MQMVSTARSGGVGEEWGSRGGVGGGGGGGVGEGMTALLPSGHIPGHPTRIHCVSLLHIQCC